ncbi:HIT domain-containing protein [Methylomonas sp. LL1]|uniref:HIT domain-containing protein n=1 Tax=Methylomonas sp. LL1 TaxID=2785785 RepID=UPI0018C448B7|nr:HIT domain-containing protein [Methylomonas sp. LL1]QPK63927.1 HIT domain-containing protein [Methylomonas sp. LL1]
MSNFLLHPRLQQDCFIVADLALSKILLMNDNQYPWFILVPRRPGITEIHQLQEADRHQLLTESCLLAESLTALYQPDKLNIAAIGNLVPQLHLHHVARYKTDKAWPAPIWGKFDSCAYSEQEAQTQITQLRDTLRYSLID